MEDIEQIETNKELPSGKVEDEDREEEEEDEDENV